MGHGSINLSSNGDGGLGHDWDNTFGRNGIGGGIGSIFNHLVGNKPNVEQPTTEVPTVVSANTTAIQNQIGKEKNATSTVLTGGQGLLDEPTTTSALLTGT